MPAHSVELLPSCVNPTRRPSNELTAPWARKFLRVQAGRTRGLGLACLGAGCLQRLVSAPDVLLMGARTWLKDQPGHRVALIESESDAAPGLWCCKETITRNWWVRFVTTWGSFRSYNAFRQGLALLQAQISTPQPLAVMAVTRGRAYHEFLLTEAVPAATSLQTWLSGGVSLRSAPNWQQRRDIAQQLGLQVQRLHRAGFDHRDLKSTNILISEQFGTSCVWLIDLDGVWRWPWMPAPRRIQNLSRLWAGVALIADVTSTDALRFLLAYLPPAQKAQWKVLWRRVARRSAAKIEQQRRRAEAIQEASFRGQHSGSDHRNK